MTERFAQPGDVKLRDYAYSTHVYFAMAAEGETLDVVREPKFWVHMVKRIAVRDVVQVIADDGSWEWHGRCTHKGNGEIYFRDVFLWERAAGEVEVAPIKAEYTVEWGGAHKHRIRAPSGDILKHGFSDKAEAQDYLRRFLNGEIQAAA